MTILIAAIWVTLTALLMTDTYRQLKPQRWVNAARNQYWRPQ